MTYGGTYDEQRYSALDRINTATVARLGLDWFADYDTNTPQEGTPLYIDGVIYVSTAWSKVYAFDASDGHELWKFDPKVPGEWPSKACCGPVNRGIAAWKGKIYLGALDGRLIAIDAATGKQVWSVLTIDPTKSYSITGAPRVVKGNVLIGNGGADFGVRGYLSAYDAETGKLKWRFYTVPGNPADGFENDTMARAAKTWSGEWWTLGGGGTVWDSFVYDATTDMVYVGTGNGSPWDARVRSPGGGDNLFLASIVALQADTGAYVWHYQTTPGESWDYTATQPIMLADLDIAGKQRRVVMQAPKNGFFYVLDAKTGELLRADAYAEMNWSDGIDMHTGRPNVREAARYTIARPFNGLPGVNGAHGWHPMAFSPRTGLVYIPVRHAYFPFVTDPAWRPAASGYNLGVDFGAIDYYYKQNPSEPSGYRTSLLAWNPVTGKEAWHSEETTAIPSGALATAGGLVFTGSGSAQELRAYDATTGAVLWRWDVQTRALAGAISFERNAQQYIAISVGGTSEGGYFAPNYSRLLVFKLNGKVRLPPAVKLSPPQLTPPPATAPVQVVEVGKAQYSRHCAACHIDNIGQARAFPDLRRSGLLHSQEAFDDVVLHGARSKKGMPSFADSLGTAETAAIRAYVIARANEEKKALGAHAAK